MQNLMSFVEWVRILACKIASELESSMEWCSGSQVPTANRELRDFERLLKTAVLQFLPMQNGE